MSSEHGDRLARIDSRNEFALRRGHVGDLVLSRHLTLVNLEAQRLLRQYPHLEGEDPRVLFSRFIVPETAPGYESALRRAAFALLHLRAVERAEQASPFTGGDAA